MGLWHRGALSLWSVQTQEDISEGHSMKQTEAHPPSDLPHRYSEEAAHLPYFPGSWDDVDGPPWLGALGHCSELGVTRSSLS